MIKIGIGCDGKNVYDNFEYDNTTLQENALVIRRLEEIKLKLLTDFEYEPQFGVSDGDEVEEDEGTD